LTPDRSLTNMKRKPYLERAVSVAYIEEDIRRLGSSLLSNILTYPSNVSFYLIVLSFCSEIGRLDLRD